MTTKLIIKNRYGVTPHEVLFNTELSLKAKGLFAYLQSKPEGWQFSAKRIKLENKEGVDAIQAGLRELEQAGYLRREKGQDEKGQWSWQYILFTNPVRENPVQEKSVQENSVLEKPLIYKERDIKKEKERKRYKERDNINSKAVKSEDIELNKQIGEVIKEFEISKVNAGASRWYGQKVQRDASRELIKQFGLDLVLQVIRILPKTNSRPRFEFPSVTTPNQLLEKWYLLESSFNQMKEETSKPKML